jgi:hypothetical protein
MNELIKKELDIKSKIYTIRGLQVMLDKDLAELYSVKSIRLREQVKRNINRFPSDFMFQLSENEIDFMVSQNAIPSKQYLGGSLPYVFTEQGVSMLSAVLRSDTAVMISVKIIRAFVDMRKVINSNQLIFSKIDYLEKKQNSYEIKVDSKIEEILSALEDKALKPTQGIFYDGQIYDAYNFVANLIKTAKNEIILIDNYIDETILTLFSKIPNIKVTIYTNTISRQLKLDFQKYKKQYNNLILKTFKDSHDRFLILDQKEIYHIGASLKDLGKKWFAFSKIDLDVKEFIEKLKK